MLFQVLSCKRPRLVLTLLPDCLSVCSHSTTVWHKHVSQLWVTEEGRHSLSSIHTAVLWIWCTALYSSNRVLTTQQAILLRFYVCSFRLRLHFLAKRSRPWRPHKHRLKQGKRRPKARFKENYRPLLKQIFFILLGKEKVLLFFKTNSMLQHSKFVSNVNYPLGKPETLQGI